MANAIRAAAALLVRSSQRTSCVSSQVSSLASAYKPARYRQWRPTPWASSLAVLSLDQPFVCEALSANSINKAFNPRQGAIFHITLIQTEGKFIDLAAQMLGAGVMIDAMQATLKNGKHTFHTVCGHVIADIFASAVIDGSVFDARTFDADVCPGFVSVDRRAGLDMLIDGGLNGFLVRASERHAARAATALAHAEDNSLSDRSASSLELFGLVFVLFNSADIGFVNLDDALKLLKVGTACFAQPMQDEPRRFLRDPDFLRKLHGRNALTHRHKQIHCVNPFMQRNVRTFENRAGANREILFAGVAAIEVILARGDALAKLANRAARTIRPKTTFKIDARGFLIGEHFKELECGNGALGHRSLFFNFYGISSPK